LRNYGGASSGLWVPSLRIQPSLIRIAISDGARGGYVGRLQSRTSLLTWIAAAFLTTNGSLTRTHQVERTATLVLLAAVTGWVASRAVGVYGGFLAAGWVLCARYLVGEPNGSHSAAAVFWMAGVGLLTVTGSSSRPAAAFLFCMSTQLRSDMWPPTLLALPLLIRRDWLETRLSGRSAWLGWGSAAVLVITILALRSHDLERNRISVLFRQSLSMTHLERTEGIPADQLPWNDYEAVWARLFPDTPDGLSLIRTRPGVFIDHFSYQARVAVRALAADILRVENPVPFLVAWMLWVIIQLAPGGRRSPLCPYDMRIGMLVLLVLVPLNCIFRVAARNLLQLVPAGIVALMIAANLALPRLGVSPPARDGARSRSGADLRSTEP
jgi:hypothetical protein